VSPGNNAHLGNEDHQGFGRILGVPPPQYWTEAARRIDTVDMEKPRDPKYPQAYEELFWSPTDGSLTRKEVYSDHTKFLHLFTVDYEWGPTGLLDEKTIERHEDGAVLTVIFNWDAEGVLVSKDREMLQPELYPALP
jgi:hypothetical protein